MSTTVEYILDVETQKAEAGLKNRATNSAYRQRGEEPPKAARGLSGSFQAVGEVSNLVNPQLERIGRMLQLVHHPISCTGSISCQWKPDHYWCNGCTYAAIGVYTHTPQAVRANEESIKKLNETLEKNTAEIEKNQQAFSNAENAILSSAGGINELRLKYAELSG